jgi:hypothetical protein
MKFIKINIVLAFCTAAIIFSGCGKDDGALPERVSVTDVPTITTNIDATGSTIINVLNSTTAATFAGKFKVDNYFPGAPTPSKVDILVRKNNFHPLTNPNAVANNNSVKVFKSGVTTLPANITVTAAEIAALFGAPISAYDNYDFGPDIYVGDRKFEAFPTTGIGTGSGHAGHPLYSEFARYGALCQDVNFHQGNFEVVSDAFTNPTTGTVGFTPGQTVTLTKVSNTRFTYTAPFVTSPVAITVNIGATTNILSVAKQKIGNAFTWDPTQTNPNITVSSAVVNFIEPCARTIDLNITYNTDQKLFPGTYLLRLRKL